MRTLAMVAAFAILACASRTYAFGIDVGPVHVHGTKVKVGNTIELKIRVEKIVKDEKEADKVVALNGERVKSDEKFDVKVAQGDLDDKSRELLKEVKTDRAYNMKLEKLDEGWKLLRLRNED